jgi:hypothetical protein
VRSGLVPDEGVHEGLVYPGLSRARLEEHDEIALAILPAVPPDEVRTVHTRMQARPESMDRNLRIVLAQPDGAWKSNALGRGYMARGDFPQAIVELERCLSDLDEDLAEYVAEVLEQFGRYIAPAIEALEVAKERNAYLKAGVREHIDKCHALNASATLRPCDTGSANISTRRSSGIRSGHCSCSSGSASSSGSWSWGTPRRLLWTAPARPARSGAVRKDRAGTPNRAQTFSRQTLLEHLAQPIVEAP